MTQIAKFTKGPWKAFKADGNHVDADDWSLDCEDVAGIEYAPIKDAEDRVVAFAVAQSQHPFSIPSVAANCRLIAAAPELYDGTVAMLFVIKAMAKELGIDPETTEFRFSADSKSIANITLADVYERADSVIAKVKEQP